MTEYSGADRASGFSGGGGSAAAGLPERGRSVSATRSVQGPIRLLSDHRIDPLSGRRGSDIRQVDPAPCATGGRHGDAEEGEEHAGTDPSEDRHAAGQFDLPFGVLGGRNFPEQAIAG
jgi:hypothetical protein